MLEQHAKRGANRVGIELAYAETHQRARPVERLGNRGRLAQSEFSNRADKARRLGRHLRVELGHLELDYFSFLLDPGKVNKQMQASATERLREFTRAIR